MLVALGKEPLNPTDEQRHMVRIFRLNGMEIPTHRAAPGHQRGRAEVLLLERAGTQSTEAFLAQSAASMVELAQQRNDLGVALRANEAILKTRLKIWREPKQEAERPAAQEDRPHVAWRKSSVSWSVSDDPEVRLLERKLTILRARQSLTDWARVCGYEPARHHQVLIEALERLATGEHDRLMVFMPPGSAKSTYGSQLFPAWFLSQFPTQVRARGVAQ